MCSIRSQPRAGWIDDPPPVPTAGWRADGPVAQPKHAVCRVRRSAAVHLDGRRFSRRPAPPSRRCGFCSLARRRAGPGSPTTRCRCRWSRRPRATCWPKWPGPWSAPTAPSRVRTTTTSSRCGPWPGRGAAPTGPPAAPGRRCRRRTASDWSRRTSRDSGQPDNDTTRHLAGLFLDYGVNYITTEALAWSPDRVWLFLTDWLPRKAMLDADDRRELPEALRRWVRFALGRRGVEERWIEPVVAAVDEHLPEFEEAFGDRPAGVRRRRSRRSWSAAAWTCRTARRSRTRSVPSTRSTSLGRLIERQPEPVSLAEGCPLV